VRADRQRHADLLGDAGDIADVGRQVLDRHRHIFDEVDRLDIAALALQQARLSLAHLPDLLLRGPIEKVVQPAIAGVAGQDILQLRDLVAQLSRAVAIELDD
jgi:hypothetical protein